MSIVDLTSWIFADGLPSPAAVPDHTLQIQLFSLASAVLVAVITTLGVIYVNRRPRRPAREPAPRDPLAAMRRRAERAEAKLAARDRFLAARGFDGPRIVKGDESDAVARFHT